MENAIFRRTGRAFILLAICFLLVGCDRSATKKPVVSRQQRTSASVTPPDAFDWMFQPPVPPDGGPVAVSGIWHVQDLVITSWITGSSGPGPGCYLAALSADTGQVQWKIPTDGISVFDEGGACRAGVVDEEFFYGIMWSTGGVWKIRADSGEIIWRKTLNLVSSRSLAWDPNAIYVIDSRFIDAKQLNRIHAIDKDTGNTLWQREMANPVTGVSAGEGKVYVSPYNGPLFALKATDGSILWTVEEIQCRGQARAFNGRLVVPAEDAVYCIDTSNGKVLWRHADELPKVVGFSSEIPPDRVYVALWMGPVKALQLSDVSTLWSAPHAQQECIAPPFAIDSHGNLLTVRNEGNWDNRVANIVRLSGLDGASTPIASLNRWVDTEILLLDQRLLLNVEHQSVTAVNLDVQPNPRESATDDGE